MSRVHSVKIKRVMSACKYLNIAIGAVVFLFVVGKVMGPVSAVAQDAPKDGITATSDAGAATEGEEATTPLTAHKAKVMAFAFLGAAFATGLGSIGAGIAVSNVGAAAMGAVAEKPELMGKSLIYVALAEGIAIYGLLISIVILSKI